MSTGLIVEIIKSVDFMLIVGKPLFSKYHQENDDDWAWLIKLFTEEIPTSKSLKWSQSLGQLGYNVFNVLLSEDYINWLRVEGVF